MLLSSIAQYLAPPAYASIPGIIKINRLDFKLAFVLPDLQSSIAYGESLDYFLKSQFGKDIITQILKRELAGTNEKPAANALIQGKEKEIDNLKLELELVSQAI